MKNILVLVGSGMEQGNTNTLANHFIRGAKESNHNIKYIFLGDKEIHGCRGCGGCQNTHRCMIKDDMEPIYPLFLQSDIIVLASPLYFWTISAQLKAVIDRLYAISIKDEYPFKQTVLLMSGGSESFYAFEPSVNYYRILTKALDWKDLGMVLASGSHGKVGKKYIDVKYLEEAYQLGKSL